MHKISLMKILVTTVAISLFMSVSVFASSVKVRIPSLSDENGETRDAFCYYNDDNSMVLNDWREIDDEWYYFGDDGISKQSTWVEIGGKWYYFDSWSKMLRDTTTPDGYQVGADGARNIDAAAETQTESTVAVENGTSVTTAKKPQSWSAKYPYVDGMSSDLVDFQYVVNTNTGKAHKPSCNSVKDMATGNTQYYSGDFSALTSGGYTSCGRCHAK